MKIDFELITINPALPKEPTNSIAKVALEDSIFKDDTNAFDFLCNSVLDKGINKFIFDLSNLRLIDSTAIGVLIKYVKITRRQNGNVALLNVPENITKIFDTINLYRFINHYSSLRDATRFFISG